MKTYFVNANLDDLFVAWEVARGVLITTDSNLNFNPNEILSPWGVKNLSMAMSSNKQYKDELKLEEVRRNKYQGKVSRLRGMYLFESRNDAIEAVRDWGGKFKEEFLTEVKIIKNQMSTRLDSEWIRYNLGKDDVGDYWIENYWKGLDYNKDKQVREILFVGSVEILDKEFIKEAFNRINNLLPDSIDFLKMSRIAAEAGDDSGHIVSWLKFDNGSKCTVSYLMKDFKSRELIEKLKDYPFQDKVKETVVEFLSSNKLLKVPDLTNKFLQLTIDNEEKINLLKYCLGFK